MFHLLNLDRRRRHRRHRAEALSRQPGHRQRRLRPVMVAAAYVAAIVCSHTLAMMAFESMSAGDALWLTLTSVTTVGYGDLSASSTAGRIATTLIIYVGGIFLVGKIAGDFFDYKVNRREMMKQGKWSWNDLQDHIVIIGTDEDTEHHLKRLIAEFEQHESTAGHDIVLISESFGDSLPAALEDLDIKYVSGIATAPENLARAGLGSASIIIILARDDGDVRSDGITFDLVHRVREANPQVQLVAECVDDSNRARLREAGATLVVRPVRAYPEMIIGALMNPGVNEVLENLFTASGEAIRRVDGAVEGTWKTIVADFMNGNKGLPIAYLDRSGQKVLTAPKADTQVQADALFVLRE